MPWVVLGRYERRALPGDAWMRVRPRLAGICGTDMALLTGRASPAMSPFVSFPAVLGHEVVAQVLETGSAVDAVAPGDRIVVDPIISCEVRGLEPCRECRADHPATCLRAADGALAPGLLLGYCRDLPGAWGDEMLVHRTQAYRAPDDLGDEEAVLVEPLSVALHAVLREPPPARARILIVGAGTLGLLLLVAIATLQAECMATVIAKHRGQARMARQLGAHRVVGDERTAADAAGVRLHRALLGNRPMYSDGYEIVFDAVGSRRSLDLALRMAGPRGRVINAGGPGVLGRIDLTPSWVRELRIEGTYAYGHEGSVDGAPHTFELAVELLTRHPELRLGELVTHRFPLEDWRRAFVANLGHGRSAALKTVFDLTR